MATWSSVPLGPLGTFLPSAVWSYVAGGFGPLTFRVIFATAINSNTVRIFLSDEPRHVSPLGSTDALNRFNWTLLLTVSGDPRVVEPEIEKLENVQPAADLLASMGIVEPNAHSIDLRTARRLANERSTFEVIASPSIENAFGNLTMEPPPDDRGSFPGVVAVRPRRVPRPVQQREGRQDFRYDFFETQAYLLDPRRDVDLHGGLEALKKRIIRRLITTPGNFAHLETYGAGLEVKRTFNPGRLAEVRAKVLEQVRAEEEVRSVAVSAEFQPQGVLIVQVTASTTLGRLQFGLESNQDGEFVVV